MKVLILCTGNSCRSQMAERFLKSFDSNLEVHSAGTAPSDEVHQKAVVVMDEVGLDLNQNYPKNVAIFLDETFDYVISVCGGARESCPAFIGTVKNRKHIGFDDPADATGTDAEIYREFRRIRDEIKRDFLRFYAENLNS